MSNLTAETLLEAFSDPQSWTTQVEGSRLLTDPISKVFVAPNLPFPWILADKNLNDGLSYLSAHGHNLEYTAAYSHGLRADESDESLGSAWMETIVGQADYFGYDEMGCTQDSVHARNEAADLVRRTVHNTGKEGSHQSYWDETRRLFDPEDSHTFVTRQIAAAAMTDTVSFSPDIAEDGTPPERAILKGLRYYARQKDTPERGLAIAGLMVAREWCIVANCGSYARRNPTDNHNPTVDPRSRPLLFLRRYNQDVSRKLVASGAAVKSLCAQQEPVSRQAEFGEYCRVDEKYLPDLLRAWKFGVPGLR